MPYVIGWLLIAELQIEAIEKPLIDKSGRRYICGVGRLSVFSCCLIGDSSDVTLAFEYAHFIQPFSREETDNTDDTEDTDDTDDTYDTYDTDDTDDTDETD